MLLLDQLEEDEAICLFFFVPDCPLSQNYSAPFRDLIYRYGDSSILFYAVVPNNQYQPEEIKNFTEKYDLQVEVIADEESRLTKAYGATVTPEFVLLNTSGILYQGALDDWVIELGKYKKRPTQFYLEDAITAYLEKEEIKIKKTTAIGCFIELE